ncbi:MAG: hypothetical protein RLZ98_3743 [Pseudomonadota bacterium]
MFITRKRGLLVVEIHFTKAVPKRLADALLIDVDPIQYSFETIFDRLDKEVQDKSLRLRLPVSGRATRGRVWLPPTVVKWNALCLDAVSWKLKDQSHSPVFGEEHYFTVSSVMDARQIVSGRASAQPSSDRGEVTTSGCKVMCTTDRAACRYCAGIVKLRV